MGNPRDTSQRRVILEELVKLKTHPTANELYEIVRRRIPKISLGTVYRNLELLAESKVIQKLGTAGAQKRFDAMTGDHYHVRCVKCGRVDDLDFPFLNSLNNSAALAGNYEIISHRLEFEGICPECRSQELVGKNHVEHERNSG
jgi:Fur family ferric uptake transcriptional regulator